MAFNMELETLYANVGLAIDPNEFIESFKKSLADWTGDLTSYGVQLITAGLSTYILLQNENAASTEYVKELMECGLILGAGYSLVNNNNTSRKYCRQYLTELKKVN